MKKLCGVLPFIVLLWCGGCDILNPPGPLIPIDTTRPNGAEAHDVAWVRGFLDGRKDLEMRDDPTWWCMERTNYADGYWFGRSKEILWYFPESKSDIPGEQMLRHRRRLAMAERGSVLQLWIVDDSGNVASWEDWCRATGTTPRVSGCFSVGDLPQNCRAIYSAEKPSP